MNKQYKLTRESLEKLKNELTYLKTVREREVAEQIKVARSFGDLSENCEYDEAKNEQGRVFSRIAELENIIGHSVIIELEELDTTAVSIGCRVRVRDLSFGDEEVYWLVGSQEADPAEMRISDESPFGKALLSRKVGDVVKLDVPAGIIEYEIIGIEK